MLDLFLLLYDNTAILLTKETKVKANIDVQEHKNYFNYMHTQVMIELNDDANLFIVSVKEKINLCYITKHSPIKDGHHLCMQITN